MARTTIEQQQERLDKLPAIKFDYEIKIKDLADVIYNLFFTLKPWRTDIFHKRINDFKKQITGSMRSRQDTYIIAKYYLEGIKYETVTNALNILDDGYTMDAHFCTTVRRRVYYCAYPRKSVDQIREILNKHKLNYSI